MSPSTFSRYRAVFLGLALLAVLACGVLGGLAAARWLGGGQSAGPVPSPAVAATPLAELPTTAPSPLPATAAPLPATAVPNATPSAAPLPTLTPALAPLPALAGKIVYVCFDGQDDELCLLQLADMTITRLTDNAVGDWYASLTPDGQAVLFARQVRGSNYEIFRMRSDGGEVTQLTQNGAGNFAPELSPDGAHIVYTSSASGVQQIWLMNADGSDPRQLTRGLESIDPTWSPDGRLIAFASNRSGQRQLWVMNADGSDPRQVTNLPDMGGRSGFSADGQALAFYQGVRGSRHIYHINLDGTALRQLTTDGDNAGPGFSPDGQWVTFASFRDGNNELYVVRPDGTGLARLTLNPRADYQPRWGR